MKFHTPYDDTHNAEMIQLTSINFTNDPGKTLQAPAQDCDLNVIMRRFGVKDGSRLPQWTSPQAIYADFTNIPDDPTELAETLRQGEIAFKILPPDLRNRFQSGAKLYTWLNDPKNADEAVKLGLLKRRPPAQPTAEQMTQRLEKAMVSLSTSSDKEPLVQTSNGDKK